MRHRFPGDRRDALARKHERPHWTEIVVLIALLFSLTVVGRTALLGGRIHHPEIRTLSSG